MKGEACAVLDPFGVIREREREREREQGQAISAIVLYEQYTSTSIHTMVFIRPDALPACLNHSHTDLRNQVVHEQGAVLAGRRQVPQGAAGVFLHEAR